MLGVLINLRYPAHEPAKGVGRIDVALSSQSWNLLAEHQQITVALEFVYARSQ